MNGFYCILSPNEAKLANITIIWDYTFNFKQTKFVKFFSLKVLSILLEKTQMFEFILSMLGKWF